MRVRRSFVCAVVLLVGALFGVLGDGAASSTVTPKPPKIAHDEGALDEPVLQGSALARSPGGARLYIADEPTHALYVASTSSVGGKLESVRIPLEGAPAQVVALETRVFVTVRDPSMLVELRVDDVLGLVEARRLPLADDAYGLSLTPDRRTALVTSAWAHRVSSIDLSTWSLRWSIDVAREPRAIAIRPEGTVAYVSHLTSSEITTLEGLDGEGPRVSAASLPVAALASSFDGVEASLGWSLAFSADGTRLFAPRRALGRGLGEWDGAFTVDVLRTPLDLPLVPAPTYALVGKKIAREYDDVSFPTNAMGASPAAVVPRASAYRASTRTLLVASEGAGDLIELDGRSLAPALQPLRRYPLDGCAAPDAIVLSNDGRFAFVRCAASFDVRRVTLLGAYQSEEIWWDGKKATTPTLTSRYADDPLDAVAALGRRLYSDSLDFEISGGFPCSGCHPDGRDDGHVWALARTAQVPVVGYGPGLQPLVLTSGAGLEGATASARQTPMLAGRLTAPGPYGWNGESATLEARVEEGMRIHRWFVQWAPGEPLSKEAKVKAQAIAAFVRKGLVPPASSASSSELDALQARGKAIFEGSGGCFACHATTPEAPPTIAIHVDGVGDRERLGFEAEPTGVFKAPSLRFVAGTAPYFHDGSAPTLEALIEDDHDRMGSTSKLDARDRAALVAYLRRL